MKRRLLILAAVIGLGAGCAWRMLPPRSPTSHGCAGDGTLQLTDGGFSGGVPVGAAARREGAL